MTTRLTGCGTALITPFNSNGSIDEQALRDLIDWQVAEGIDFLVPCGSTGEAATMTLEEHRRVVEITVHQVAGRVPVCAGAGSNDTQKAVALSREMKQLGATHLLHVSPMYNKPPQRGIVQHFKAVADATDLPVIAYNVPGRTGSNMESSTTLALGQVPNIAGVKEASGNLAQVGDILRGRAEHFAVLSGDDELTLAMMALGADGVISVISNATPKLMVQLVHAAAAGRFEEARAIHFRLHAWMRAAFVESNPVPVKSALAYMGKCRNVLRQPLVPLAETHSGAVRVALREAGVTV